MRSARKPVTPSGARWRRRLATAVAAVTGAAALLPAATAHAATAVGPWIVQDTTVIDSFTQGQGLATVTKPDGSTSLWFTGIGVIDETTYVTKGWTHIGDPDSAQGYTVEPYQGDSGATAKMFRVWKPDGTSADFTHTLASGEAYNNSFAAISPDGQWLVSGEYGTKARLLVHPMPYLNSTAPSAGSDLPLTTTIKLNRSVRDVQGCDFVTGTQLLCSSDDPAGTLFGMTRPLLQINLSAALSGSTVTGTVTALGPLPMESTCTSGTFEAQGIDYDSAAGDLRFEVIPPGDCILNGNLYRLRHS